MTQPHPVGLADEIKPGSSKIVDIAGRSIGVFNVDGTYYAIRNVCPHQLAPLCRGRVTGTTKPSPVGEYRYGQEGQIIHCPWHGWEFDITTGKSVFNPNRMRVPKYQADVRPRAVSCNSSCETTEENDATLERYPVKVVKQEVVVYV